MINIAYVLTSTSIHAFSFFTGPSQVRFAHTDVKIPDFQAYRRAQNKDAKSENKAALPSRMFTYAMTSGIKHVLSVIKHIVNTPNQLMLRTS